MDTAARQAARETALQHAVISAADLAATLNHALDAANYRARERTLRADWDAESVESVLLAPARQTGSAQYSDGHGHAVPNCYRGAAYATTQDVYVYRDRQGILYAAHSTGRGQVPYRSHGTGGASSIDTTYLRESIDPRFRALTRREAASTRRRVRAVRRWWWTLAPSMDRRQRSMVRRHLAMPILPAGIPYCDAEMREREALMDGVRDATLRQDARGILLTITRTATRHCYCIVRDATHPERLHALPVPPNTSSCTAGLAWCARMTVEQYQQLAIES